MKNLMWTSWSMPRLRLLVAVPVLSMAVVAPVGIDAVINTAAATNPTVSGVPTCDKTTGMYDILWNVTGDASNPSETATVVSQSVPTAPTLVGQSAKGTGSISNKGLQKGVTPGSSVTMVIKVQWTNHSQGDLVQAQATVKVDTGCTKTPPPTIPTPPTPPPPYTCPSGTTWVDADSDGVVDQNECQKMPPPAVLNPKAKVRAYCVTPHWGEGVARLINKYSTEPARYRIMRSGKDRTVTVRAGKNQRIELRNLRVGSVVKVKAYGNVLDRAKVGNGCQKSPPPHSGARVAAG